MCLFLIVIARYCVTVTAVVVVVIVFIVSRTAVSAIAIAIAIVTTVSWIPINVIYCVYNAI